MTIRKTLMKPVAQLRRRLSERMIEASERIQNYRLNRPIPCDKGRMKLSAMLPDQSTGIELGVAAGYFSDALLRCSSMKRLYSIDAWADHHDSQEYLTAVRRLAKHGNRSVVLRMFFDDALELFADNSIDFIYLDAYAHTGQENGQLIDDWWPKLKSGGIFAGHDYDSKWPQTVQAVDDFCQRSNMELNILPGVKTWNHQDRYASWYVTKPA